ncbi:MAG: cyclic pyranopterin monophosphate synthase MoaC [Desulfurococcaceae archaeon]|nr:cyclic pyranopterin monophosphate synthase MoaC [Desulfurococcaceae archaeon]
MARMVDVSLKGEVYRVATARGCIRLRKDTIDKIVSKEVEKGDVIAVTQIVAIESAKKTYLLLPFCHPIRIDYVEPRVWVEEDKVCVEVTVKARERTGVEMEALTAVSISLLNIWDIVKKYEKDEKGQYPYTAIENIVVVSKEKIPDT